MPVRQTLSDVKQYTVGWIAALPKELAAARGVLDEEHTAPNDFEPNAQDSNNYHWGRIGSHNVVIASLPAGRIGTVSAAVTANNMAASLPHLRFCLMVGIGGGVPGYAEIRLGDVVVSRPCETSPGVIQYDIGRILPNGKYQRIGNLNSPPEVLLKGIASLESEHYLQGTRIDDIIGSMLQKFPRMRERGPDDLPGFVHQGAENDRLFEANYVHEDVVPALERTFFTSKPGEISTEDPCRACDMKRIVHRPPRASTTPRVHYGTIASGNSVIKDGVSRDEIVHRLDADCLCFEMEAAGLMNSFPCLVIRGICDYCDSHKNYSWQAYAAATAAAYAKELVETMRPIDVYRSATLSELVIDISKTIHNVEHTLRSSYEFQLIQRLPIAEDAAFDSYEQGRMPLCLQNTRVDIIKYITDWAISPQAETMFWLSGIPGAGKSTISRSIAQMLANDDRLGASFFFRRGFGDCGTAKRFFSTIAKQLSKKFPDIRKTLEAALEANPDITNKPLPAQFEELLLKPLAALDSSTQDHCSTILVIDALDECDDQDNDVKLILSLFERFKGQSKLRLFLTSRPELPIRLGFASMDRRIHHDVVLHRMTRLSIERDLELYLRYECNKIQIERSHHHGANTLQENWPGDAAISMLVKMAKPLFIFAMTVCRWLGQAQGDPDQRLRRFISRANTGKLSQMEQIYLPILSTVTANPHDSTDTELIDSFKALIGPIIVLFEPLSRKSAEQMGIWRSNSLLDALHSVLEVPENPNAHVRLLHQSFRDFLLDQHPSPAKAKFCITEAAVHVHVARSCFKFLNSGNILHRDMLDLGDAGILQKDVSAQKIKSSISASVSYACRYFTRHLIQSGHSIVDGDLVHKLFLNRALPWIETLSWLGRATQILEDVQSLISLSEPGSELNRLLIDVQRFAERHYHIIATSPLQLYSSALIFSPQESHVSQSRYLQVPPWLTHVPRKEELWGMQVRSVATRGSTSLDSVVFPAENRLLHRIAQCDCDFDVSEVQTDKWICWFAGDDDLAPNGLQIATRHSDRVRLWDAITCELLHTLRCHDEAVELVVYSTDSALLAITTSRGMTWMWNPNTGQELCRLAHESSVHAAAFANDSHTFAVCCQKNVQVWESDLGKRVVYLTANISLDDLLSWRASLSFSADNKLLILAGIQTDWYRAWNLDTRKEVAPVKAPDVRPELYFFSQILRPNLGDHKMLRVKSMPLNNTANSKYEVNVYNLSTGEFMCSHRFRAHWVFRCAISPDGKLLAICGDRNIATNANLDDKRAVWLRVWHLPRFELCLDTDVESQLDSMSFSPDCSLLASLNQERLIQIFRLDLNKIDTAAESESTNTVKPSVKSVVFSIDGDYAIGQDDSRAWRVWDARTSEIATEYDLEPGREAILQADCAFLCVVSTVGDGQNPGVDLTLHGIPSGARIQTFSRSARTEHCVAVSAQCDLIATLLSNNAIGIRGIGPRSPKFEIRRTESEIDKLAFSPDGQSLMAMESSPLNKYSISVYDASTGRLKHSMVNTGGCMIACAASSHAQYVAVISNGTAGRVIHRFRLDRPRPVGTVVHHHQIADPTGILAIPEDGNRIAYWDLKSALIQLVHLDGAERHVSVIIKCEAALTSIAFSEKRPGYLATNCGFIRMGPVPRSRTTASSLAKRDSKDDYVMIESSDNDQSPNDDSKFDPPSLFFDGEWILEDGVRSLYIPVERRGPVATSIYGQLVIGQPNGDVSFYGPGPKHPGSVSLPMR